MLERSLLRALFLHGKLTTTRAKAQFISGRADRLISTAKKGQLSDRRALQQFFGSRAIANTLVDRIAPIFSDRTSGFTRMISVGKRRGDNTPLVELQLVEPVPNAGSFARPAEQKPSAPAKKTAAKKKKS